MYVDCGLWKLYRGGCVPDGGIIDLYHHSMIDVHGTVIAFNIYKVRGL